jgi:WD40 repeat protein
MAETADGQRTVALAAFRRALVRETHVLRRYPELLWQQIHNRLQWEDEQVRACLAQELDRRSLPGSTPWLRTRMRYRESEAFSRTLTDHHDAVSCCAFTPDGRRFLSGGNDGTVRVWDPGTGKLIAVLRGHDGRVNDCVVVDGGAIAVTAGWDGTLRAWAIGAQTGLGIFFEVDGPLLSCAAAPTGKEVFAGGPSGALHAVAVPGVDQAAGTGTRCSSSEGGVGISAVAVSPDGTAVACGHSDGSVTLWDPGPSQPSRIAVLGTHDDMVFSASFTPDGTALVTGDGTGILRLWDWAALSLVTEIRAHVGVINDCVFYPDGAWCVTVGDDTKIRIAPVGADHPTTTLEGHHRPATCCAVSPSAALLASGSDDGTIRMWELDAESAGHGERIAGHERWAVASSFSADGTRLVTGSREGDVIVWDPATGGIIGSFGPQPGLEWCDVSPDGNRVVSGGDGAALWDVASGGREAVLSLSPPVRWCGFSADGEVVAGLDNQGKWMWDLTEPDPPFVMRTDGMPPAGDNERRVTGPDFDFTACRCAFSPFGSRIASPGPDGTVLVWEIDADRPHVLGRHDGQVAACAWDPGGQIVASAGEDRVVRLWDVQNRTPSGTLEGHAGWVNHLQFLEQGLLVSVGSDGTLRLWDTDAEALRCCYPSMGNVFLSCAVHPGHRWLCTTDIAGDVVWLALEWARTEKRSR